MSLSAQAVESAKRDDPCCEESALEAPVLQLAQYLPCIKKNARAGARHVSFLAEDAFFRRAFSLSAAIAPRRKTRGACNV